MYICTAVSYNFKTKGNKSRTWKRYEYIKSCKYTKRWCLKDDALHYRESFMIECYVVESICG